MRTWLVKKLGEPEEALRLEETAFPVAGEGEVVIKVKAAALNFADILLCQGKYQEKPEIPFTLGSEISGTIIQAGMNSSFVEGQRVMANPSIHKGGLAEYISVPESAVYPIPDNMTWEDAASLFLTYHTAYYALYDRAKLQSGETLLVHAGAGGVGSAAIQLGKAAGAFVIATAGGSEKTQICKSLGADVAIDYLTEDFVDTVKQATNGRCADVIFETVGGSTFDRSRKCIAFDGRLLVIGFAGGDIPQIPAGHVLVKNYSIVGVHWGYYKKHRPQQALDEHHALMDLYRKGLIKPMIFQTFDFNQVPEALRMLAGRKTWGKLVIKI
jgi:NADPH2:quinone reductase